MTVTEKEYILSLVKRIQNYDADATELLYKHLANKVYYFALKLVKNPEDARDIMQESFIQAFQKIDTLEQPEAFCSWLYCITSNKCKNFFKKNSKVSIIDNEIIEEIELIDEDEAILPEAALNKAETSHLMKQIIDKLPEMQRSCIILYYFNELSVREIAVALECSEGTIKSRLNYARKQIKEGVLDLEKNKATKLYNLAPLGALLGLLRNVTPDEILSRESIEVSWQALLPHLATLLANDSSLVSTFKNIGEVTKSKIIDLVIVTSIVSIPLVVYASTHQEASIKLPAVTKQIHEGSHLIDVDANVTTQEILEQSTPLIFQDPYLEQAIRAITKKTEGPLYNEDIATVNQLLVWGKYIGTELKENFVWMERDEVFVHPEHLTPGHKEEDEIPVSDSELENLGIYKLDGYITNFSDLKQFPKFYSLSIVSLPDITEENLQELTTMGIHISIY